MKTLLNLVTQMFPPSSYVFRVVLSSVTTGKSGSDTNTDLHENEQVVSDTAKVSEEQDK